MLKEQPTAVGEAYRKITEWNEFRLVDLYDRMLRHLRCGG